RDELKYTVGLLTRVLFEPPFSPAVARRHQASFVADCRYLSPEDPFSIASGSPLVARREEAIPGYFKIPFLC
ncbi:hypothetical protein A2U01_0081935, partial [Trifolium medium]|nr:hypothetical protein [Trifolium medium]